MFACGNQETVSPVARVLASSQTEVLECESAIVDAIVLLCGSSADDRVLAGSQYTSNHVHGWAKPHMVMVIHEQV